MVIPVFLGLENHRPRFMNSQNAAGRLKLNQLAKSAVCLLSVSASDGRRVRVSIP
jgi:hypothetical protein